MASNRQSITSFSPAVKQKAAMAIGLAGASGSGKTWTALELAVGLAGPDGTIGLIDTEGRRALHYARHFKFEHCDFSEAAPFTPERCTQAIEEAHARFDVVVFDSFSDEYEGEGGFLDMGEAEGAAGWPKTKGRHKESIIRYIRRHARFTIFCLRAEEKVRFGKDDRGKLLITPLGWMPICEKRFMYDMTLSLTLSPETPGLPRFDLPRKLGDQFKDLFPPNKHITREAGAGLRAWALDTDPPASTTTGTAAVTVSTTEKPAKKSAADLVDELLKRVNAAVDEDVIGKITGDGTVRKQVTWLMDNRPEEHKRLFDGINAKRRALKSATSTDGQGAIL